MNENEINIRLRRYFGYKGMTKPSSIAKALKYNSPEKISRLLRDSELSPSSEILQDIAKVFVDLNFNWIFTGEGNMLLDQGVATVVSEDEVQYIATRRECQRCKEKDELIAHYKFMIEKYEKMIDNDDYIRCSKKNEIGL